MGRRSTSSEFFLPGSEANLMMLAVLAVVLVAAGLVMMLLPWWALLLSALVPAGLILAFRD